MGPLCDQWGRWGPPAAVVGAGEGWTHSPTVWGRLTPAQTLWPVGGSQECPSSLGGTLDRQGGLGRRVCTGRPGEPPPKGPSRRGARQAPWWARDGWRSVGSSPSLAGEGEAAVGSGQPTVLGCLGFGTLRARTGRVFCCWPLPRAQDRTVTDLSGLGSFLPVQ